MNLKVYKNDNGWYINIFRVRCIPESFWKIDYDYLVASEIGMSIQDYQTLLKDVGKKTVKGLQ